MTTDTETRDAIHLFLAERLPELRNTRCWCGGAGRRAISFLILDEYVRTDADYEECRGCQGRGWVPNVTMDGLLEALPREWTVTFAAGTTYIDVPGRSYGFTDRWEATGRNLDALCAAAKKALEAV